MRLIRTGQALWDFSIDQRVNRLFKFTKRKKQPEPIVHENEPLPEAVAVAEQLPDDSDIESLADSLLVAAGEQQVDTLPDDVAGEEANIPPDDGTMAVPELENAVQEEAEESESSLFQNLFDQVSEREETPLDRLIDTLPEVTVQELIWQAEEVEAIIMDWPTNR